MHHSPAPRDFAPTPAGWAAIIIATAVLGWWVWRLGGEGAGVPWMAVSVIGAYVVAMMAWSAIRGFLDDRDGTR